MSRLTLSSKYASSANDTSSSCISDANLWCRQQQCSLTGHGLGFMPTHSRIHIQYERWRYWQYFDTYSLDTYSQTNIRKRRLGTSQVSSGSTKLGWISNSSQTRVNSLTDMNTHCTLPRRDHTGQGVAYWETYKKSIIQKYISTVLFSTGTASFYLAREMNGLTMVLEWLATSIDVSARAYPVTLIFTTTFAQCCSEAKIQEVHFICRHPEQQGQSNNTSLATTVHPIKETNDLTKCWIPGRYYSST